MHTHIVVAYVAACLLARSHGFAVAHKKRVLVLGSINVDLYQRLDADGTASLGGRRVPFGPVKGQTLPAASFVKAVGETPAPGMEEQHVLLLDGPFEQKTGGKGANAAAAAGQTYPSELIANFGGVSAKENALLRADLEKHGCVHTSRCPTLEDTPTGTAFIMLFADNDNAIVLIGGANQQWPAREVLMGDASSAAEGGDVQGVKPTANVPIFSLGATRQGAKIREAVGSSVALMLQREVPEHVNVAVASVAHEVRVPVFMDVGGTDEPLDPALLPYISVVAPNESELQFISGVDLCLAGGGELSRACIRTAVAALKAKFAAAGNDEVEVLVTLGMHGSLHCDAGWTLERAAEHETRMGCFALTRTGSPVDTTGAGDCFRGSYVSARYGEGRSVVEAMRWAAAAASLAVEVEGAMVSMPTREQIAERAKGKVLGLEGEWA